jgi:BirA family transcriptional regulator, biotin operon repressor / biotin---[acetyl-CoA-carboxylase] ligase
VSRWLGAHRIDLEVCGSTNDEAGRLARAGASHGTVVIARAQTAGRGRSGRVWQSPPDAGLYVSAVVRPPFVDLVDVPPMTLAIGIGLCEAVRACGAAAVLKWPNDLLVDGKKLAGVLVESQSQGSRLESVVVGIGVNLTGELPPEVAETAITLERAAGHVTPRELVIDRLCTHVEYWIDHYIAGGLASITAAWHARMAPNLSARATVDGMALTGQVAGIDGDGALLLRDDAGHVHRVRSGDVEAVSRPC